MIKAKTYGALSPSSASIGGTCSCPAVKRSRAKTKITAAIRMPAEVNSYASKLSGQMFSNCFNLNFSTSGVRSLLYGQIFRSEPIINPHNAAIVADSADAHPTEALS